MTLTKIKFKTEEEFDNALTEIKKKAPEPVVRFVGRGPHRPHPKTDYAPSNRNTLTIDADDFVKETLNKAGIEFEDLVDFSNWELRFDAVGKCKELVNESPITIDDGKGGTLPLRAMIQEWYTSAMSEVNDFIKTGSGDFLRLIEEGDEFWWDLVSSEQSGSVRFQAINLIKPLVV